MIRFHPQNKYSFDMGGPQSLRHRIESQKKFISFTGLSDTVYSFSKL